jgi:6,7-dimethyl-8-ribityllumazine synthase
MSERIDEIESRLRDMEAPPQQDESRDGDAPDEPVAAEPEAEPVAQHAAGELRVPDGYTVLSGGVDGRRTVAVVVSRFNGEITNRLLERALEELEEVGVTRDSIMVMPVPGAFELPLAAMALAKTRRYACVVALGCVIRGDTPHFDYVAGECARGLMDAGLTTGVPVIFGVLTTENLAQAEERADIARMNKGRESMEAALEMIDLLAPPPRAARTGRKKAKRGVRG